MNEPTDFGAGVCLGMLFMLAICGLLAIAYCLLTQPGTPLPKPRQRVGSCDPYATVTIITEPDGSQYAQVQFHYVLEPIPDTEDNNDGSSQP